ncbi:MAG: COG1470 family protein [Candidatus Hadarchaeaceae archaeon]
MMKGIDQRGVEPLAMKLFAGIVLLVIGLGIGYAVYTWAGRGATGMLSFTVSVSPTSATVSPGNTITVSVSVQRIGPYDKEVSLLASGVPDNVKVSFSPNSGVPAFGSTMTVVVDSLAPSGTTTITVRATGTDGIQQTATFELTVE